VVVVVVVMMMMMMMKSDKKGKKSVLSESMRFHDDYDNVTLCRVV